ncbi:MAG: LytR/AlgR family response regulator transcription factor [Janthinobacterium lividum]
MNILIVEDEPRTARTIERLLRELRPEAQVVGQPESVAATVAWLTEHPAPDLILMDIHLSDGSSFEVFRRATVSSPIIFITAYDEHALEAFQVSGIDYLLKPITRGGLLHGLRKYEALRQHYAGHAALPENVPTLTELLRTVQQLSAPPAYKVSWLIPFKAKLIPVATADVAHFIIRNGVVSLTTLEGQHYPLDTPLDELEAQVDPRQFFRANRQVLLARPSVTALEPYYNGRMLVHAQPAAPEAIIVPKPRVTELRHWLSGS